MLKRQLARFAAMGFEGKAPVHLLLTSVVDHVTVQQNPTARQRWDVSMANPVKQSAQSLL